MVPNSYNRLLQSWNKIRHEGVDVEKQKFLHTSARMCVCVYEHVCKHACAHASSGAQSCPILCKPIDSSPPGSSNHGIFQARVLEWVAISFSRGSCWPRDQTCLSCISWMQRDSLSLSHWGSPLLEYKFLKIFFGNNLSKFIAIDTLSYLLYGLLTMELEMETSREFQVFQKLGKEWRKNGEFSERWGWVLDASETFSWGHQFTGRCVSRTKRGCLFHS